MRSLALGATLLAAQASTSVAASSSSNAAPRAVNGNGVFRIPINTVDKPKNRLMRRQDGETVATVLDNMDFFYATTLGLGSPPQNVTVLVDTGSSELWVNPDCSRAGSRTQTTECRSYGQYNPDDSTTPPVGPFSGEEINYGDPSDPSTLSSVNIEYYADNVGLGGATLRNQTFGVVTSSSSQTQGIMGLAPDLIYGFAGESNYSLLLNTMAEEGIISNRLFSLDLRHANSETGAIIYGGVDKNKFVGTLEKMDMVRGAQGEYRLAVNMQTIGVTSGSSNDNFDLDQDDQNVMLDSGTTLSRMHASAALPVLDALGAQDDGEGYYVVPCSIGQVDGTIDFGFDGVTIRVPLSDFILDVGDPNYCYAGVTITTDQQILGDTVLRAGYFVFDWDSETISIAQAANCGNEDIVSFNPASSSVTGNCQSSDIAQGTGTITATRTAEVHTTAYTTTYTVTSCPSFDDECATGRVTTQTVTAVTEAPTSTGGGDDNGVMRLDAAGGLAAGFGALAAMYNVM